MDKKNKYSYKHKNQFNRETDDILSRSESWKAIAKQIDKYDDNSGKSSSISGDIVFSGKVLDGGDFHGENFENANFSGSYLKEINLSKANLTNVDFTGADLSGADLSGAILDGAVFTGAKLRGTNFTGAHMHGVKLIDADIQDAILLNVDLDALSIEELQELIEFLAKYYPHKLNLTRLNLTLLDLKRLDLRNVDLTGVDFTGCDFTGVNIYELDLSRCVISIAQIEQAIGHIPTPLELKKLLAPKNKKGKQKLKGIDLDAFFRGGGGSFDWDATKGGTSIETMFKKGKEFIKSFQKGDSDDKIMEKFSSKEDNKEEKRESNVDDLRKTIEQHKKEYLEQRKEQQEISDNKEHLKEKIRESKMAVIQSRSSHER